MPKYEIEMTVFFAGEVEADSEEEAHDIFIEEREVLYYQWCERESIKEIEDDEEEK